MKTVCSNILSPLLLILSVSLNFATSQEGPIVLFENQIAKTSSYDSLGTIREFIQITTNLDAIGKDHFVKELKENTKQAFYIKADKSSLKIVAANNSALENGIFFYLYHLGFRYYYPNPNWHYYPNLQTIFKPIEGVFKPDYLNRKIRYNFGTGSSIADQEFRFWEKANLMSETIPGFTGHSYEQIIKRNRKKFLNHPEYFANDVEKGQIPKNPKFDVSNQDLVQLVIEDALQLAELYYERYGPRFIISLDPSDAGGYCNKPSCSPWKTPSDQVYYLANQVAQKLKSHYPEAYVGLYAYNQHAAPPSFDLENNILIYIATSFNTSKLSYDELIDVWSKKVNHIGIRDYYGVANWDWDLPGKGKGTKPLQIHSSINTYYDKSARLYYIESLNGWITKGLGHYIAARSLWDVGINPKKEINEFYTLMFEETSEIMKPLMEDLMNYSRDRPLDKDLENWINSVLDAFQIAESKSESKRIEDVMQYLYAMTLFIKRDKQNPESFQNLYKFLHQINDESNYASYAIRRVLFNTLKEIMPESIISTRSSALNYGSSSQIDVIDNLDSILNILEPIDWTPYDLDLKLLDFKDIPIVSPRSSKSKNNVSFREQHVFLLSINQKSSFKLLQGLVDYKNKKDAIIEIFDYQDYTLKNPIRIFTVPPGNNDIVFTDLKDGKYWMSINDNRHGFRITEMSKIRISVYQNKDNPLNTFYRNKFYFYVPAETSHFIIRRKGSATIISPSGRKIELQRYGRSSENIKVNKDEYGLWHVEQQKGSFFIDGIPPFFSNTEDNMPIFRKKKCFLLFWR